MIWTVPVLAVAFLYVAAVTIAAIEVATVADFALRVSGPSLPPKSLEYVGDNEKILNSIAAATEMTTEQVYTIICQIKEHLDNNNK